MIWTWLSVIFNGTGLALLISPAFMPEMIGYSPFGFVFLGIGIYFINKALEAEQDTYSQ